MVASNTDSTAVIASSGYFSSILCVCVCVCVCVFARARTRARAVLYSGCARSCGGEQNGLKRIRQGCPHHGKLKCLLHA